MSVERATCSLKKREENGKRYFKKLYYGNIIKFFAGDGNVSWCWSIDGNIEKVGR